MYPPSRTAVSIRMQRMNRFLTTYRQWAAVLALCLFALAFQGSRGLWSPDEGRYAEVSLEMLRQADITHPMLNPEHPHYTKPPLTYWSIATSMAAFGTSEWAVRLPYAIAFIATVLLIYWMGTHLLPQRPWLPALIYATSLLPYAAANAVTTDTLLTLCETLAMAGFVAAAHAASPRRQSQMLILMWFGFGLAFLAKGPPGLLPLFGVVAYVLWQDGVRALRRIFPPAGIFVFLVVGLSWYIVVIRTTPGLLDYFLHFELVDRIATSVHHRHGEWYGGFQIYLPTLLIGGLPWNLLLVHGLIQGWRERRDTSATRLKPDTRLLLLWLLLPLIVFFLARSRLPLYLLPLFVPLSLLTARLISYRIDLNRTGTRLGLVLLIALLVTGRWYASNLTYRLDDRALAQQVAAVAGSGYREIVFVDDKPRFGLGLYLNVEVERVCFRAECTRESYAADEMLDVELTMHEPDQLYLIAPAQQDALIRHMVEKGVQPRALGQAGEFALIAVK